MAVASCTDALSPGPADEAAKAGVVILAHEQLQQLLKASDVEGQGMGAIGDIITGQLGRGVAG